ncbi:MAG: phosphoribosylamine--glycine ligase [Gammaproteobacteria bacterium]|nr:MAG: phosphoribosylamine--glycine ligase [Gammaproteobacteria bacterium]
MNILIIGSGGREHALAWKIAQSPKADKVYVAPGNAGTAHENKIENIDIGAEDIDALLAFAGENTVDLTIVGPEVPLVLGIVDQFQQAGLRCFGPGRNAAQLEGSKTFTKDFLKQYNIPTAAYQSFTDATAAINYIKQRGTPIVIKADGLAAGKGVILAETENQAIAAVENMLSGNVFGEAGHRVVVEEFLKGEEASFICMVDGEHILPLATSQDHKARDNGDKGPNTGGMGAYSPAPVVTEDMHQRIMAEVIGPTVKGMAKDGFPYTGFLYAGLMIDKDGVPKVLEYNCRFGDPETQPVLLRLRSDLIELVEAALDGRLNTVEAHWDPRPALGVVMAAGGYPEQYHKGDVITGSQQDYGQDIKVFHAGTTGNNGDIVTNGGRVLCVTALGDDVADARQQAYKTVEKIRWKGAYYRTDIGYRAIDRQS